MPGPATHYIFASRVWDDVAPELDLFTPEQRDAFYLGSQGPDPLLHDFDPRIPKEQHLGSHLHLHFPHRIMLAFKDSLDTLTPAEREVGRAYLAGFLCHYNLDRNAHPLVYIQQFAYSEAGVDGLTPDDGWLIHSEIERDFDEAILWRMTRRTIQDIKDTSIFAPGSPAVLMIVGKMYAFVAKRCFDVDFQPLSFVRFVKFMRLDLHVLRSTFGIKRFLAAHLEQDLMNKDFSLVASMSWRNRADGTSVYANEEHHEWENPYTGALSRKSFWDIFEDALAEMLPLEQALFAPNFDEAASKELCKNINFDGMVVSPDERSGKQKPYRHGLIYPTNL